jgi:tetratricopeptide (TPR) repeat protein
MEVRTVKQLQRSQYIELAVVRDILQKLQDIESSCEGKVGEDIIEQRTKQLALAKILCKVYHKDQNLLIRAHCELGIAYLDMEYIEQAKEHLINAFQLNENPSIEDTYSMKEYQLKIMVHLSKCYYDEKNYSIALEICEHTLKTNQKLFGENHLSNGDLYYMLGKVLIQLEKYTEANENFEKMKRLYNEHYGKDSEKVAKVYMEIARLYEIRKKNTKARKTYRKSYEIFEKIIEKEESKEENKKDSNNKNKKQSNSKSNNEHESNSSKTSRLSSSSSISSDSSLIDIENVSSLESGDEEEKTGHKKKKEKEKEKKKKEKNQIKKTYT